MTGAGWVVVATAPNPGAIAVLEIGGDAAAALTALSDRDAWPIGRLRHVPLGGVDDGIAVRTADDRAIVMPHGGLRVVERLLGRLADAGFVRPPADEDALGPALYPEARDDREALALAALARAASPLAVALLLDQPRRWRDPALGEIDAAGARRLAHLLHPADVVLAGPPNVGKSTLSNALLGRRLSIPLDRPGTTRDYTAALVNLGGLVVRWHDTPGFQDASAAVEVRAGALARDLVARADLLVAVTAPGHAWPELPRKPDLRISNKRDLGERPDADLEVSARTGEGLPELAAAVRDLLVPPPDLRNPARWRFWEAAGEALRGR